MAVNVDTLARLSRIALDAGDHEKIEKKVTRVLEHFNLLNKVDTTNVAPFFHPSPEMELREDIPEPPIPVAQLMKNAPDAFENCFRIPKVVGDIEQ